MSSIILSKIPIQTLGGVFLLGALCDFINSMSPSSRLAAESYYDGLRKLDKYLPIGLLAKFSGSYTDRRGESLGVSCSTV